MAGTVVVERTARIRATPEQLVPLISRLPEWTQWSPWEDLDPDLRREYSGEPGQVGSAYTWSGNRKAGAGEMRITAVDPDGESTRVTWQMETPQKLYTRFVNLDKLIGGDFEKGLRKLTQVVEAP